MLFSCIPVSIGGSKQNPIFAATTNANGRYSDRTVRMILTCVEGKYVHPLRTLGSVTDFVFFEIVRVLDDGGLILFKLLLELTHPFCH